MSKRLIKIMAILLTVLFLLSIAAVAASAKPVHCHGRPHCDYESRPVCDLKNGLWKCKPIPCSMEAPDSMKAPKCGFGDKAICEKGYWRCKPYCPLPKPWCPNGQKPICYRYHWQCGPEP